MIIFLRNRNRKNRFTKSKDNEMQEGKFSFITWCVLYVCKFHHDSSSWCLEIKYMMMMMMLVHWFFVDIIMCVRWKKLLKRQQLDLCHLIFLVKIFSNFQSQYAVCVFCVCISKWTRLLLFFHKTEFSILILLGDLHKSVMCVSLGFDFFFILRKGKKFSSSLFFFVEKCRHSLLLKMPSGNLFICSELVWWCVQKLNWIKFSFCLFPFGSKSIQN